VLDGLNQEEVMIEDLLQEKQMIEAALVIEEVLMKTEVSIVEVREEVKEEEREEEISMIEIMVPLEKEAVMVDLIEINVEEDLVEVEAIVEEVLQEAKDVMFAIKKDILLKIVLIIKIIIVIDDQEEIVQDLEVLVKKKENKIQILMEDGELLQLLVQTHGDQKCKQNLLLHGNNVFDLLKQVYIVSYC